MKIEIQSNEKSFNIDIPNFLLFSNLGTKIMTQAIQLKQDDFSNEKLNSIQNWIPLLSKMAKKYKGMEIISVESQNETIHIYL